MAEEENKKEEAAKEDKPQEAKPEDKPAEETKTEEQPKQASDAPKKVNYVYGALLLHSAGKPIDEAGLKKVIEATGEKAEDPQVKALVSSLEGVDIEEAIKSAAVPTAAAPAAGGEAAGGEDKKEEKTEEDQEKKAEEAAAGLSSLFG